MNPTDRKNRKGGVAPRGERGLKAVPPLPEKGDGRGGGPVKVKALRTAVESGEYRVEPKKVAERIVMDAVREIRNRLR